MGLGACIIAGDDAPELDAEDAAPPITSGVGEGDSDSVGDLSFDFRPSFRSLLFPFF